MAEAQHHTINATVAEEDKDRVYALDLAVRTVGTRIGTNGSSLSFDEIVRMTTRAADKYLAWLQPERPQDQ